MNLQQLIIIFLNIFGQLYYITYWAGNSRNSTRGNKMEIYFKTEENTAFFSTNRKQIVELRGLTVDEVEKTIKFYNDLKAAKE